MTRRPPLPIALRAAAESDVPAIHALVEAAYRGSPDGEDGWTTEAHLLMGTRTTADEVRANVADPASEVLVATVVETEPAGAAAAAEPAGAAAASGPRLAAGEVVGTVHLRHEADVAEFGMFAVSPRVQSRGVGSQLVRGADRLVRDRWGLSRMRLTVIGHRQDLTAWYLRLGFVATGEVEPFPGAATSTPLVDGIEMQVLVREIPAA